MIFKQNILAKIKRIGLIEDLAIVLLLAFISLIPAFWNHFYNLSLDGSFHLARFANVSESIKSGHIPSLFNFIYSPVGNEPGSAINAMYPWIMGLLFAVPQAIIGNPMLALSVGFFLLHILTIVNAKLLMEEVTSDKKYVWLGVIVYQFNNFHFIDLYTRTAMGEAFGYTWLPLVLLGLIRIKKMKESGTWVLGFSLGMLANSHVLTLLIAAAIVLVFEVIQLINHRFSLVTLRSLFVSGMLAVLIGGYSLYNIIYISLHTSMLAPGQFIVPIDPVAFQNALLTNNMDEVTTWTYGLPLILIQVSLTVIALTSNRKGETWKSYLLGANLLVFTLFNWIPWDKLIILPFSLVQFAGRLEVVVVLLLAMSIVLYYSLKKDDNWKLILIIELFLILFPSLGAYQTHRNFLNVDNHAALTAQNYDYLLKSKVSAHDYLPDTPEYYQISNGHFIELNRTIDSVTFEVHSKHDKKIVLPAAMYYPYKYVLTVDGKKI